MKIILTDAEALLLSKYIDARERLTYAKEKAGPQLVQIADGPSDGVQISSQALEELKAAGKI